jgi:hypothetical protein
MKVRWKSVVFLLWVLTLSGFPSKSEADIVRGKILQTSRMGNGAPESPLLSQKLEDLWLIALEEEQDLLKGIEIFIEAPKEAQTYRGTYAFYLYGKISPTPTAPPQSPPQSYEGTLLYFRPFVNERKLYVQIPLQTKAGFSLSPDTAILDKPVEKAAFPLLFTFLPIMKGIPEPAYKAEFKVQVRALWKDLGKVRFTVKSPKGPVPIEKARIFLDDQLLQLKEGSINLEPGLRNFRVEIDGFPPFQTTVALEKGKVVTVEATFIKKEATVHINAPLGTLVFIDGKPVSLSQGEFSLDPGEHTFSFRLGDYQVSKRFYMEQGKSYGVSLYLDILINED